jgi:tetratricopeptide (TPR) repeat protein
VTGAEAAAERVDHLRRLNRLDDAEREARAALAAEPEDQALLCALAIVLLDAKRYPEGLAAAEAAAAAAPDREHPHRLRGLLLSRLGRHPEALHAGYHAVSLAPDNVNAALGYATVLRAAGRLPDALQVARRAVSLDPNFADSHLVVADISDSLGHRAAARAAYQEVLRLEPDHALARHDLAVHDLRAGRTGNALRGLVDAGAMDPTIAPLVSNMAAVLWTLTSRLRVGLIIATLATLVTLGENSPAAARVIAALVVLATGGAGWWTLKDIPPHSRQALRAALRSDVWLSLTCLLLAAGLGIYLMIPITGHAYLAAFSWLILAALAVLTLLVRVGRRLRRR